MIKEYLNKVSKREYDLYLNDKNLKIKTKRIKGLVEYVSLIANSNFISENNSFFIYNEKNFASFGMLEKLDLVFVDWDNKVIHIEENFERNKISKNINKPKFIYILEKNTVLKKGILLNDILKHEFNRKKIK